MEKSDTPTPQEMARWLVDKANESRRFAGHSEDNRDDWFATMPPDISAQAIAEAEKFDQCAAALERLSRVEHQLAELREAAWEVIDPGGAVYDADDATTIAALMERLAQVEQERDASDDVIRNGRDHDELAFQKACQRSAERHRAKLKTGGET